MKKLLIATTALVATAGVAAADVSVSGLGRFGLVYQEAAAGESKAHDTLVSTRLQFNFDAVTETDTGITFGARLRMRNDDGDKTTAGNAAQFHVTYEGLRVELGNVNTAADSVALTYNSEMGYENSSFGDTDEGFFFYNSKGTNSGQAQSMGVAAFYSIAGVNLYASYIDPSQTDSFGTVEVETSSASAVAAAVLTKYDVPAGYYAKEVGVAADYEFNGFTVAAAYTDNSGGVDANFGSFIGAAYAFGDANVGINYYNVNAADTTWLKGVAPSGSTGDANAVETTEISRRDQVTLWGNYSFGDYKLQAYVSELEKASKTAYGLGASYALGSGVKVLGAYQADFDGLKKADIGIQFAF